MFSKLDLRKRASSRFIKCVWQPIRRVVIGTVMTFGLASLLSPGLAAAQGVDIIKKDLGGSLETRLKRIAQLRADGTRVEIRGQCASACTLFLGLPNACVARSSRLGFHGPQSQFYGISLPADEFEYWSHVMADHYPAPIRKWFMAEVRQTTMGLITISGAEAIRMGARPCA